MTLKLSEDETFLLFSGSSSGIQSARKAVITESSSKSFSLEMNENEGQDLPSGDTTGHDFPMPPKPYTSPFLCACVCARVCVCVCVCVYTLMSERVQVHICAHAYKGKEYYSSDTISLVLRQGLSLA